VDILLSDEMGYPSLPPLEEPSSKNSLVSTTEREEALPVEMKDSLHLGVLVPVDKETIPASQKVEGYVMEKISTDLNYLRRCFFNTSVVRNQRFIIVSSTLTTKNDCLYQPVSISRKERSKLSRKLFIETINIPNLTAECSQVLQEARQLTLWDQAIAELYAQVLTITHCPIGDDSLQGLREYMLTVHGIAC
jgi:hypothetical protein